MNIDGLLIIDAKTGTILSASDCYVVDTTALSADDDSLMEVASDSEICELAQRVGKPLSRIGQDTGWGDNAYRFTVSYSPISLRDEADAFIEGGVYTEGDDEYNALMWAKDVATTEQLEDISYFVMSNDGVWDGFRENFLEGLMWVYKQHKETK